MRDLSPNQRKFLHVRLITESDQEAIRLLRLSRNRVNEWKQDPEFLAEYNKLWSGDSFRSIKAMVRATMEVVAEAASKRLLDLVESPDDRIALGAIRLALQSQGILKTVMESTHTEIPWEVKVAIQKLEAGEPLPPSMLDLLHAFMGQNHQQLPPSGPVIDQ